MEKERITFENKILDSLIGKIFLLQDLERKREVMFETFLEIYNSPIGQEMVSKLGNLELERFFQEFISYDKIEGFLSDPDVEDIMVNNLDYIFVHKSKVGLFKTDKRFDSREELDLFIKKLIIFSGRKEIKKINNVELSGLKGRVNIIFSPFGPQLTITRAKENPLSIIDLIIGNTLNPGIAAQFWIYVEGLGVKPANLLISGGPGSGKTTLLNALFNFFPENDRIVIAEDTLELNSSLENNCSRLESDEEITLADLVKNSLRMRPERIIVGEVRGIEALDLMTVMNIGKYCMGTLHASTSRESIIRLTNEPMNVPVTLVPLIDVIVVMRRYQQKNNTLRVVGEVVETAGIEQEKVLLSSLWSYDLARLQFRDSAVGSVYRDRLAEISGRSAGDIIEEIKLRANLLKILVERNIREFSKVTAFCRRYVKEPQSVLEELGLSRQIRKTIRDK